MLLFWILLQNAGETRDCLNVKQSRGTFLHTCAFSTRDQAIVADVCDDKIRVDCNTLLACYAGHDD